MYNHNFVFTEPVKERRVYGANGENIIQKYWDQNKYAFSFQMMAYITRLKNLKKAVKMATSMLSQKKSIVG